MRLTLLERWVGEDLNIVVSPEDDTIIIRLEDVSPNTGIVISPEDIESSSIVETGDPIVIRPEDLPGVPYQGTVPAELIQVILPPEQLYALERRMLDLINADRAAHPGESRGARPLEWDNAVAEVARAHSEDMVGQHYMGHINRADMGPADRLGQAGIGVMACGENIAGAPTMRVHEENPIVEQIYTGYPNIEQAEEGLMNSPDHRKNILNPLFTHVGVGIARNPDGTLVITQNFTTRSAAIDRLINLTRRRP